MKVLILARPNLLQKPGGDGNQIRILQEWLSHLGCEVELHLGFPKRISADVVHCFNISRTFETCKQLQAAQKHGVPAVLSLVHQDLRTYHRYGREGWPLSMLKILPHSLARLIQITWQNQGLYFARPPIAGVIAHSKIELGQARQDYSMIRSSSSLISGPWLDDHEFSNHCVGLGSGGICVGRIEDLKNQKNMAMAALQVQQKLTFFGPANPLHKSYCSDLSQLIKANPRYLKWIQQPSRSEVLEAFRTCTFHIQCSWFETAGISTLEALACDKPVICSSLGYASEIFSDLALYSHPSDIMAMANCMQTATQQGSNTRRLCFAARHMASRMIPEVVRFYQSILQ